MLPKANNSFFIVFIEYIKPLSEIDEHLQDHKDFLQTCYNKGHFIASGKKVPRTGGIIIASMQNKTELIKLLQQDPFYKNKLSSFDIQNFKQLCVTPSSTTCAATKIINALKIRFSCIHSCDEFCASIDSSAGSKLNSSTNLR